jgi:hypothetical protein
MSKLFTASSAISAASAYIGYQGAKAEGKSIQAAQEYNAAISENQAEVEQRQTEEQIRRMRVVNREILDNQTARHSYSEYPQCLTCGACCTYGPECCRCSW